MTKTEITNALNNLKKHGFSVYTFNSNKPMPIGLKGLPDHIVFNEKGVGIWWLEIKLGKDKESKDQRLFREMIQVFEKRNAGIYYRQVNELNLGETIQEIYGK